MYLVAYNFHPITGSDNRVLQTVVESVEECIDDFQQFDDGEYIVINVLPISSAAAKRWDGALHGM